jgi:CDP-diglyceride synthetase
LEVNDVFNVMYMCNYKPCPFFHLVYGWHSCYVNAFPSMTWRFATTLLLFTMQSIVPICHTIYLLHMEIYMYIHVCVCVLFFVPLFGQIILSWLKSKVIFKNFSHMPIYGDYLCSTK